MASRDKIKDFLTNNPEIGAEFHNYWVKRREELLSVPWVSHNPSLNAKSQMIASFIQNELIDDFGLHEIAKKY